MVDIRTHKLIIWLKHSQFFLQVWSKASLFKDFSVDVKKCLKQLKVTYFTPHMLIVFWSTIYYRNQDVLVIAMLDRCCVGSYLRLHTMVFFTHNNKQTTE